MPKDTGAAAAVNDRRYRFSGAKLRAEREAAGRKREEIALAIGRSASLVTVYELSYRQPPPPVLMALAEVLGVHVEDFFEVEASA